MRNHENKILKIEIKPENKYQKSKNRCSTYIKRPRFGWHINLNMIGTWFKALSPRQGGQSQ